MNILLLTVGVLLLAHGLLLFIRFRLPLPEMIFSLFWGVVVTLAGLEILRYSELNWRGAGVVMFFVGMMFILFRLLPRPALIKEPYTGSVVPSKTLLLITRLVSVAVLIGIGLRYIHVIIINNRPLFDIREAYQINASETMTGTIYSRLSTIMFLWPLPATIFAWYLMSLRWFDRVLFGLGTLGLAAYGVISGGRSSLTFTFACLLPLMWLSMVRGPNSRAASQLVKRFGLGLMAALACGMLLLTMLMFGVRTYNERTGRSYSQSVDINPLYQQFVSPPSESSRLEDGLIGAIGYATQPMQRLSLFFELDLNQRLYGAYNLEIFVIILRRMGIADAYFTEAVGQVEDTYREINMPVGTFSSFIRDVWLDFGFAGVVVGGVLLAVTAQKTFRRVVQGHSEHLLPILLLLYGLLLISPLFSGLTVAGVNQSLIGFVIAVVLIKNFGPPELERKPVAMQPKDLVSARAVRSS
jgi:hypothetical protein